jgi:hypothetical protein
MAESGNWLQLRMSGFRFYEKPPLVYWMTAASIEAFGHTAFAIRLPAALCGGLAALAVGVAARRGARLAGTAPAESTVVGALVALASLTMVLPAVGSSVAILDQPIAGLTLAASCAYFMAVTGPDGRARFAWLAASGVFAGLAFMTKGLLAVVFPAVTLVPWLAWERRWRDLFVTPWIVLAVGAAVGHRGLARRAGVLDALHRARALPAIRRDRGEPAARIHVLLPAHRPARMRAVDRVGADGGGRRMARDPLELRSSIRAVRARGPVRLPVPQPRQASDVLVAVLPAGGVAHRRRAARRVRGARGA